MPGPKLSSAPSPRTFADALRREILEPAARQVAGADGTLDPADAARIDDLAGGAALAAETLRQAAVLTGQAAPGWEAFVVASRARADAAAATAAGPDGRLSAADVAGLPEDLRLAFQWLRQGFDGPAPVDGPASDGLTVPSRAGIRFSEAVFREVAAAYGLVDGEALLDQALALGDGSAYVTRSELEVAAQALRWAGDPADPVEEPLGFSESVLASVMERFAIVDRTGFLEHASRFDADGNRYLKRSELEAAAKVLTGAVDLGIISDIDKTLLPPHDDDGAKPPPYPGVSHLIDLLERQDGAVDGDTHYVTARTDDRVVGMDDWMAAHGLPAGSIHTGISGVPWVAQAEKVRDISAVFDANPDQKFVLFGDSSHKDPEVYREIMARYPDRVVAGFIHKVNNPSASRLVGLHLVESYAEAAAILYGKGVLSEAAARSVMVRAQVEGLSITDAEMTALLEAHRPS